MIEVKDKNLSAVKCINTINQYPLQKEWEIYQFSLLERSYDVSNKITLEKDELTHLVFYNLIEEAMKLPKQRNLSIHAFNLIWEILKDKVFAKDILKYDNLLNRLKKIRLPLKQ